METFAKRFGSPLAAGSWPAQGSVAYDSDLGRIHVTEWRFKASKPHLTSMVPGVTQSPPILLDCRRAEFWRTCRK